MATVIPIGANGHMSDPHALRTLLRQRPELMLFIKWHKLYDNGKYKEAAIIEKQIKQQHANLLTNQK